MLEKARDYIAEVKSSRGLSLFLQDFRPSEVETRWFGFLTEHKTPQNSRWYSGLFQKFIQFLPRRASHYFWGKPFNVTPAKALYARFIDAPVGALSQNLTGNRKQLSGLMNFGVSIYAFTFVYDELDHAYKDGLIKKVDQHVDSNLKFYLQLLTTDYRYHVIQKSLKEGKVSQREALRAVYATHLSYQTYYTYVLQRVVDDSKDESRKRLLEHALFEPTKRAVESGIKLATGFESTPGFHAQLTPKEIDDLLEEDKILFMKYELVSDMYLRPKFVPQNVPQLEAAMAEIKSDEFTQALEILVREGKLSLSLLVYYLQEDAYWRSKLAKWEIVHLRKMKMENDVYTKIPLTLDDVRMEMIDEIRDGRK